MSPTPDDTLERLYLVRAELNRMSQRLRTCRQVVARTIEAAENTNDSPQEDTRNDRRTDTG